MHPGVAIQRLDVLVRLAHQQPVAVRLALEFGVAVAPGRYFDAPTHFRISLAGATAPLAEGLSRITAALRT